LILNFLNFFRDIYCSGDFHGQTNLSDGNINNFLFISFSLFSFQEQYFHILMFFMEIFHLCWYQLYYRKTCFSKNCFVSFSCDFFIHSMLVIFFAENNLGSIKIIKNSPEMRAHRVHFFLFFFHINFLHRFFQNISKF